MEAPDLLELKKHHVARHGRLHAEAWRCRMAGDIPGMLAKQKDAKVAMRMCRFYDILLAKVARDTTS